MQQSVLRGKGSARDARGMHNDTGTRNSVVCIITRANSTMLSIHTCPSIRASSGTRGCVSMQTTELWKQAGTWSVSTRTNCGDEVVLTMIACVNSLPPSPESGMTLLHVDMIRCVFDFHMLCGSVRPENVALMELDSCSYLSITGMFENRMMCSISE